MVWDRFPNRKMLIFSIRAKTIFLSSSCLIGGTTDSSGVAGAGERNGHLLGFLHEAGMKSGLSPDRRAGPSPARAEHPRKRAWLPLASLPNPAQSTLSKSQGQRSL
jgi:hypothetical protein